ncbi:ABC transporter substrate-binding protein [Halanaerocella petrolearia]
MKPKIKYTLYLLVAIIVLGGSVAQATDYPVTVVDDLNNKVRLNKKPQRIISLAPNHTETLFTLGLEDRIVGVTEYADYPQPATKVTGVGNIKEPNLEKIIQLQPDLVLAAASNPKSVIRRLRKLGVNVIGLNPQTIDEIMTTINLVGKVTDKESKADKVTTEMKNKVEKVTNKVKRNVKKRPKVFYEVWKKPLYTAGPNTFINNLISLAGGVNIAYDAQSAWPQYSFESLLAKNPAVYLATNKVSKKEIMKRDKFQDIKAIKEGRVYILNPDIVNRAGPRIVTALEEIAKAIHPELF